MFTCPNCNLGLSPWRHGRQTSFFCPTCRGMALTRSSLERSVRPAVFSELTRKAGERAAALKDHQFGKPCPACHSKSVRILAQGKSNAALALDYCATCQMIWFDRGEIDELDQIPEKEQVDAYEQSKEEDRNLAAMLVGTDRPQFVASALGVRTPDTWLVDGAQLVSDQSYDELVRRRMALDAKAGATLENPGRKATGEYPWLTAATAVTLGIAHFTTRSTPPSDGHLADGVLICNIAALLLAGGDVEELMGTGAYLALLVGAATGGTGLGHTVTRLLHLGSGSFDPTATVAAVLVFYALAFPSARVSWREHLGLGKFVSLGLPAWALLLLWIVAQAVLALGSGGPDPVFQLATLAGGLLAGVVSWLLWK